MFALHGNAFYEHITIYQESICFTETFNLTGYIIIVCDQNNKGKSSQLSLNF